MNHTGFPVKRSLAPDAAEASASDDFIDLERVLAMVLRQAWVLILCALAGLGTGALYLATTPPTYTADSSVLIDEKLSEIVEETSSVQFSDVLQDSAILSQIEIIKSGRLAQTVVEKAGVDENESFMQPPTSLLSQMIDYARWPVHFVRSFAAVPAKEDGPSAEEADEVTPEQARQQAAARALQYQVSAERVGRSHVISIAFSSHDPHLAASITNAYAEAFVSDQLDATFEATERAALWLEERLAELRESSQAAALAVEKYRAEHGLSATRGELMAEQRLSDLNSELAVAKADTARAYARYQQYKLIVEGGPEAAVRNTIISNQENTENSVPSALKTRYLNATRREQEVSNQFGSDHPQAVALRREKEELARQIHEELSQLTASYQNEYEVALAREEALQESVTLARGESSEAKQSEVQLRELEQKAAALSSLYQAFLARYEEATQQSGFPISKARVISTAEVPRKASSPRTTLVLGLSLVMGLMVGGALGALNEFNERFFRTGEDVRDRLGARFLGYLPLFGAATGKKAKRDKKTGTPARQAAPPYSARAPRARPEMRLAIEAPASAFAETLRSAKFACDLVLQGSPSKVIGIASALPGEGKSTVAANFSQLLAVNDHKTLLIDGDLRNPGLSRNLGFVAETGLLEAVVNGQSWRSVAKFDQKTGLAVVPALMRAQFSHTSELLSSAGMRRFLQEARAEFEYIVVDLPPFGPVIDAKAFAPLTDGLLVVVEWGRTPRALVRSVLGAEPAVADRVLGVMLNKVDMKALSRYGAFGSSEKYFGQYAGYYGDDAKKG